MHWRHFCRILHRDIGYLLVGLTLVYAISGIALNHRRDWNPSYSVEIINKTALPDPAPDRAWTRDEAVEFLKNAGVSATYKKHYTPQRGHIRIFLESGGVTYERATETLSGETLRRRPLLHTFNKLHYNPGSWWTWFADGFCVALIIVAITGIVIVRGKHGITRRGGLLILIGIVVPAVLVLFKL